MQTTSTFGTIITLLILHHDNCVIFRMRKRTKSYFYWRTIGWNRFWKSNHLYFHVHACIFFVIQQISRKGQIKPKADWCAIDSPKKRKNEFGLLASLLFTANKTNSFLHFLGESTARPNCTWFYLNFNWQEITAFFEFQ